jgi:hypothetical protein
MMVKRFITPKNYLFLVSVIAALFSYGCPINQPASSNSSPVSKQATAQTSDQTSFTTDPVSAPEPSTLLLVTTGVASLVMYKRRKRHS